MKVYCSDKQISINGKALSIDGYTFKCEIGRGANGVIIEALDDNLLRPVAIKIWHSSEDDDRDKLIQGKNEAIKIASIPHKNIVTIFNAGIIDDFFYLVMELLPGKSLREVLAPRLPELGIRTRIWREIEKTLRHTYRNSVLHGDLHDRNIMIVDGDVKIIDFGTSYFYSEAKSREEDESLFVIKIARNLFPEIESTIRKHDKNVLKSPMLALQYCDSMTSLIPEMELLSLWAIKEHDGDYSLKSLLYGVALTCAKSPYVDIDQILSEFCKMGFGSDYLSMFLDECYLFCVLMLNPEIKNTVDCTCDANMTDAERYSRLIKIRNEVKEYYNVVLDEGVLELDAVLHT